MPISATGSNGRSELGFTLVELMVVLVIIALASAAVAVSLPSGASGLRREATAFAARAGAARNAAIVGGRPVRVAADASGYRVEERRNGRWLPWGGKAGRAVPWDRGTVAAVDGAVTFDSTGLSEPALLRIERAGTAINVRVDADGSVRVEG
jgi:general secretion pathway protein H